MVTKRTIFNAFGKYYYGESTDTKPTNAAVNDRFLELDTAREFFFNGTTWVRCGSVVYHSISATITNGTASGATRIGTGQTVTVTLSPAVGYALPTSVTVEGATASYNATTGVITLSNATGDVTISAACVAVYTITTTVTNGSYTGDATILDGGTASVTLAADEGYALPSNITVSGASYAYDSTTGAVALSSPTGAVSVSAVCEVPSSYPVKGDIINIDMDGDGTDEQYLVLKSVGSDNVVEVLARVNYSNAKFADSGQVYEGGTLDIALNTTYYATLSADAKTAIVDKTFRQDSWYRNANGRPDYNGSYGSGVTYTISLGKASFGNEITRHIYAISAQDIIDYLEVTTSMTSENSTLNKVNVQSMFNVTSGYIWLRSARADDSSRAIAIDGAAGSVDSVNSPTSGIKARPAFQIDLSKIDWSVANA